MTLAHPDGLGWRLVMPQLVGDLGTLLPRLIAKADGGAVAFGADFPIGLPRAYAAARLEDGFRAFLHNVTAMPDFFTVCATLSQIHRGRPFYPARGVADMTRLAHASALGLVDAADLSRACDRATAERPAGTPLFWTLGANQTGKAAITAWRDLLNPALTAGAPLRLWPYDGSFLALLSPGYVALAETYPAEALRHLGIRLRGSKRRQADRVVAATPLLAAMDRLCVTPDNAMMRVICNGFGADAAGEDRFDSVLGVLCVLNVLAGHRPDIAPADPWVQRWEGWVLGQTSLPSPYPAMPAFMATAPLAVSS